MRPLLLAPLLALTLAACGGDGAETTKTAPAAPAVAKTQTPKTPVQGAKLTRQGFDRDGDGKVETWRKRDRDGNVIEERDTDGDGIADVSTRIVTLQEGKPPGIEADVQPLEPGQKIPAGMTPIK